MFVLTAHSRKETILPGLFKREPNLKQHLDIICQQITYTEGLIERVSHNASVKASSANLLSEVRIRVAGQRTLSFKRALPLEKPSYEHFM
jgi:hypothetical protein